MKTKKTFKIGSAVFFADKFDDYASKDVDELHVMDSWIPYDTNVLNMKRDDKDVFYFRDMTKDEFIEDTLKSDTAMRVGKFLVPEFCEYIGFTVDDFERLKQKFDELDERHTYERLIRDAYVANGAFALTDGQLKQIYDEYKRSRGQK